MKKTQNGSGQSSLWDIAQEHVKEDDQPRKVESLKKAEVVKREGVVLESALGYMSIERISIFQTSFPLNVEHRPFKLYSLKYSGGMIELYLWRGWRLSKEQLRILYAIGRDYGQEIAKAWSSVIDLREGFDSIAAIIPMMK